MHDLIITSKPLKIKEQVPFTMEYQRLSFYPYSQSSKHNKAFLCAVHGAYEVKRNVVNAEEAQAAAVVIGIERSM